MATPETLGPPAPQSVMQELTNGISSVINNGTNISTSISNTAKSLSNAIQGNLKESMVHTSSSLDKTKYDVIRNYPWTLTPMSSPAMANRVPAIYLYEYQMTKSMLIRGAQIAASNISNSFKTAGAIITRNPQPEYSHYTSDPNSTDAAYDLLFDYSGITNFVYTFPYYNTENINAANAWTQSDATQAIGNFISKAAPLAGKVVELANAGIEMVAAAQGLRYPNVGFADKPMTWAESTKRSFSIEFFLYNTLSYNDIQKNWELCNQLYFQNSYAKITMTNSYPPVFYKVFIPGQYSSPGAIMKTLNVENLGNIRTILMGNGITANIPDAYKVTMTLEDMVMPSRNLINRVNLPPIVSSSVQNPLSPLVSTPY